MLIPTVEGRAVLLPGHSHPEFGKPGFHYHIDWRYEPGEPRQNDVVWSEAEPVLVQRERVRPGSVHCHIPSIMIPFNLCHKYAGVGVSTNRCPHRGLPLVRGVCLGHGLCTTNGKVTTELYLHIPPLPRVRLVGLNISIVSDCRCTVKDVFGETKDGRIFGRTVLDESVSLDVGDTLHLTLGT